MVLGRAVCRIGKLLSYALGPYRDRLFGESPVRIPRDTLVVTVDACCWGTVAGMVVMMLWFSC